MIKSIFLKNALINTVFKAASIINRVIPKDDRKILLYSERFSDNLYYLYEYLLNNGYRDKYQIICAGKSYEGVDLNEPKVKFITPQMAIFYFLRSAHVFYRAGRIPIEPSKKQITIQMWHGTSFKGFAENQVKTNSFNHQFYSYVYASSDYFIPIVEKKFSVPRERVYVCGHPRTDVFYNSYGAIEKRKGDQKVILWLPTFRKSEGMGMVNGADDTIVPIIGVDELKKLGEYLRDCKVKLIIKLHAAQDVTGLDDYASEYLEFLTHKKFVKENRDLYKMLKDSDALITDYSSVFYDYLLLNRPIGFTEDDIDKYADTRGFAVDPDRFRPGARLRNLEDLKIFIKTVITGEDSYKKAREEINNIVNYYQDGKNCERTLNLSGISID